MIEKLGPDSQHEGHHWVKQQLRDLALLKRIAIESVQWYRETEAGEPDVEGLPPMRDTDVLEFHVAEKRYRIGFLRSTVKDCEHANYVSERPHVLEQLQEEVRRIKRTL